MGKFKIRCIYTKHGCEEILLLDNLENHEKSCEFEKPFCKKCFCDRSSNHDCIKSLLDLKQKLTQENENLQKELKSANDKIHSMREEMDNHLQKLMKLTIANEAKVIPSSTKTVFINTIYSIFN